MDVVFDHSEQITPHIKTFWFRPKKPVRYIAGQFTELFLPHRIADNRGERRWFTLSSSPSEPLLSITVKFATSEGSTFKRELAALQPGTPLKLADPMGDFVLPKDASIPLIFIASGIGVTPMRSMVKWLHDTGERRDITLLYTVKEPAAQAFEPLFAAYGLNYVPLINQPLTTEHVLGLANAQNALIYMAGPEILVETLTKTLVAQGVAPERVVSDYFPGYTQV